MRNENFITVATDASLEITTDCGKVAFLPYFCSR